MNQIPPILDRQAGQPGGVGRRAVPGSSVDGMVNVTFPSGSAQGTFHAVYCAGGNEF